MKIRDDRSNTLYESETATTLRRAVIEAVASGANLRGADLSGADLSGVDLRYAALSEANLFGANLSDAHLSGANLFGANLSEANLSEATLRGATLSEADLSGVDLSGADLRSAYLHDANLSEATILPNGVRWDEYLHDVVPALCTAGGKTLEEVAAAWDCHDWGNCPMSVAFGARIPEDVPPLYRREAELFVLLLDARLIPCPVQTEEADDE